jgi:hypothetical protein
MTPAISCEAASISFLLSAGPASLDPNTMRAFARVSSFGVFGCDSGGGDSGAVRVAGCVFDRGLERSSSESVSAGSVREAGKRYTCVEALQRPGLLARARNVAFGAPLYPVAILKAYSLWR